MGFWIGPTWGEVYLTTKLRPGAITDLQYCSEKHVKVHYSTLQFTYGRPTWVYCSSLLHKVKHRLFSFFVMVVQSALVSMSTTLRSYVYLSTRVVILCILLKFTNSYCYWMLHYWMKMLLQKGYSGLCWIPYLAFSQRISHIQNY